MTQSIVDTDTFVFDSQGQHCSRHVRCVARAELTVTASRRRFSAQHKRKILEQADRCSAPGEIGALLRREGLYSSHLSTWRDPREQGAVAGTHATQA